MAATIAQSAGSVLSVASGSLWMRNTAFARGCGEGFDFGGEIEVAVGHVDEQESAGAQVFEVGGEGLAG